jgi:hypothetical protein
LQSAATEPVHVENGMACRDERASEMLGPLDAVVPRDGSQNDDWSAAAGLGGDRHTEGISASAIPAARQRPPVAVDEAPARDPSEMLDEPEDPEQDVSSPSREGERRISIAGAVLPTQRRSRDEITPPSATPS